MDKVKLTDKQIEEVNNISSEYINKYTALFADIRVYKDGLDSIQKKLDETLTEFKTLKDGEEKMYVDLANGYGLSVTDLKEFISEMFSPEVKVK